MYFCEALGMKGRIFLVFLFFFTLFWELNGCYFLSCCREEEELSASNLRLRDREIKIERGEKIKNKKGKGRKK